MENDKLDLDWLQIQKKLSANIDGNYVKENMTSICIHHIYIDARSLISNIKIQTQDLSLSDNLSSISREKMLQIIQTNRVDDTKKYKFQESLLYNVDLEPNNIQLYTQDASLNFLKQITFMDVIKIPPSLFIFHQINCLYCIYQEITKSSTNKTKKVAFKIDNYIRLRHTQKVV